MKLQSSRKIGLRLARVAVPMSKKCKRSALPAYQGRKDIGWTWKVNPRRLGQKSC